MKRMMTRIDDELHTLLKAKAKTDGCSMNALVVEVLQAVADRPDGTARRQPGVNGFDLP
ncbi:toxin-antitoxin system HicB family antitoxin [Amycolatopsis sp. NBC_01480]|jgi:predicted HicB family RNase H-like nuclease|uniref:toxin-antitoxin system HicB family antitoxin n=1 Tax=Amycolatopsis sp. NBC_01480 TaxID=2903562 RepID=UPI002E29D014|nr:toxin-antitoxin system HicB family antitoxin [Amycolatopsis sp. NBC_01480]